MMPVVRRALAAFSVAAVAVAAAPAQAAEIRTLPCINYIEQGPPSAATVLATMPLVATGFLPSAPLTFSTTTPTSPAPLTLATVGTEPNGFLTTLVPPPRFAAPGLNIQSFTLTATPQANGAISAPPVPFQMIRFGLGVRPSPKFARSRVTYTARGFLPGATIYLHFRFGAKTRRTVRLGVAGGMCGTVSRKMRALPTKVRFGTWRIYVDQSKRYSRKTIPQWRESFNICRGQC